MTIDRVRYRAHRIATSQGVRDLAVIAVLLFVIALAGAIENGL